VGQLLEALRKGGAISFPSSAFSQSVSGSDS
jgi:hypothetical protein